MPTLDHRVDEKSQEHKGRGPTSLPLPPSLSSLDSREAGDRLERRTGPHWTPWSAAHRPKTGALAHNKWIASGLGQMAVKGRGHSWGSGIQDGPSLATRPTCMSVCVCVRVRVCVHVPVVEKRQRDKRRERKIKRWNGFTLRKRIPLPNESL